MADYWPLDKIIKQGEVYTLPNDRAFAIKKIGTDQSSDVYLKIDGVDTGAFNSEFAPMAKTSSNLLGPLDLGDYLYVVPNSKKFWLEGPSGGKCRIIGDLIRLAPNEALDAKLVGRFSLQGKAYMTYVKATATLASAGGSWPAGSENVVLSLTPKTIETYLFNSIVMASVAGAASTPARGDIALRFALEGVDYDLLTTEAGRLGVDLYALPYPPSDSTEEVPFSLEKCPITVEGDRTFQIKAVNTSGGAISASSTAALTITVLALTVFSKK
jgi:hypothetical protein